MSKFLRDLQECETEEAVKSTFLTHSGFTSYIKHPVDLYLDPVLFEFKLDVKGLREKQHWVRPLAQALTYTRRIYKGEMELPMPTHVAVVDRNEAMLFPFEGALQTLVTSLWGTNWKDTPSSPDKRLVLAVQNADGLVYQGYDLATDHGLTMFVDVIRELHEGRECISADRRRIISAANFEAVFAEWSESVGQNLTGVRTKGPYFVSDLRTQLKFTPDDTRAAFDCDPGKEVRVAKEAYNAFWRKYGRPPTYDIETLIMSKLHIFASDENRRMDGAFYTPTPLAELAMTQYFWQQFAGWSMDPEMIFWDPCCGTGNLEVPMKGFDQVMMSTLDMSEVLLLKKRGTFPGAEVFTHDFLNGDVEELPSRLRKAIKAGKVIIYMNPPYADAGGGINQGGNKVGVRETKVGERMAKAGHKGAARDLLNQFLFRAMEVNAAGICLFSTTKPFCAARSKSLLKSLRADYQNQGNFMVPVSVFPKTSGEFPVCFSMWRRDSGPADDRVLTFDVYDKSYQMAGRKTYTGCTDYLNAWFSRPACTVQNGYQWPMNGPLTIVDKKGGGSLDKTAAGAFGYVETRTDITHQSNTQILSGVKHNGNGCAITPLNLELVLVQFSALVLPKHTWTNGNDQFYVPTCDRGRVITTGTDSRLPREFRLDAVVHALFHGKNNTSAFTGTYQGKSAKVNNLFFPWSHAWVNSRTDEPALLRQVELDCQPVPVANWLDTNFNQLSQEAKAVLTTAEELYRLFYKLYSRLDSERWKLGAWNPGWYQVRMSLKEEPEAATAFEAFKRAFGVLQAKLRPQVYSLGFMNPDVQPLAVVENEELF